MGLVREIDLVIFRAINGASESFSPVMVFLSEGNKWWPVRITLLLLFIYFLQNKSLRKPALLAMVSWPVANAACDVLKSGLQWGRPCVELSDVHLRVDMMTSFGSASAHSATMMAVAVAFLFSNKKVGIVWLVVAFLTGLSRIYVGVHYPYQVLLGWMVGGFVAFVAVKTWQARESLVLRREQAASTPIEDQ